MTKILSIETSTPICSIAIHQEGILLDYQDLNGEKSHSEQLTLMIEDLLKKHNMTFQDLSAIAVSSGPGSYTGLRIGTSTAKGLCFALDIPLISVSTLEAIAYQVEDSNALICPLLDARRMEVYCMLLDKEHKALDKPYAKIIDESSFAEELSQQEIIFVGNATEKCVEVIQHENAIFRNNVLPSARSMGKIAFEKYTKETFEDVAYFEPFYLKAPNITTPKKKVL
ncbi:MAG: tRNA (adenosine(37)-N6)-threonylcarbamoyltransferase complex dimerization subunit type 1 TsaB [Cytophagales bacterium]|nr:tRNA (adenosine(37)-N6)-threonylcarbamoyltransferase complex dimerization subunit type 1 TsaB [Cytophagales bacterium]